MKKELCNICEENPLSPRSRLPTCPNCRASINRWAKRKLSAVIERRRKLHIYDTRMSTLVDKPVQLKLVSGGRA